MSRLTGNPATSSCGSARVVAVAHSCAGKQTHPEREEEERWRRRPTARPWETCLYLRGTDRFHINLFNLARTPHSSFSRQSSSFTKLETGFFLTHKIQFKNMKILTLSTYYSSKCKCTKWCSTLSEGDRTVPRGSTVHAASITFDGTVRWLPAVLTVTVVVAVTHLRDRHRLCSHSDHTLRCDVPDAPHVNRFDWNMRNRWASPRVRDISSPRHSHSSARRHFGTQSSCTPGHHRRRKLSHHLSVLPLTLLPLLPPRFRSSSISFPLLLYFPNLLSLLLLNSLSSSPLSSSWSRLDFFLSSYLPSFFPSFPPHLVSSSLPTLFNLISSPLLPPHYLSLLPPIHLTLLSPHLVPSFTIPGSGTSDPSLKSTPKHFPPAIGVVMIDGSIPKTVVCWTLEHCSFPHRAFLQRGIQTSCDQVNCTIIINFLCFYNK